jgi:TPR repeat protein
VKESRQAGLSDQQLVELEAVVAEESGHQNYQEKDYAAAARDYQRAADLGRDDCLPCLADALVKQGKYEEGVEVFSRALSSKPGDIKMLANRGRAYMKLGKVREGLADWMAAAQAGDAYSQNELGRLYMMGVPGVVAADPRAGIDWFRKSAAQGNAAAIQNLATASKLTDGTVPQP